MQLQWHSFMDTTQPASNGQARQQSKPTWSAKLKFMRPADRRTTVRGMRMRAVATQRAMSRPAQRGRQQLGCCAASAAYVCCRGGLCRAQFGGRDERRAEYAMAHPLAAIPEIHCLRAVLRVLCCICCAMLHLLPPCCAVLRCDAHPWVPRGPAWACPSPPPAR